MTEDPAMTSTEDSVADPFANLPPLTGLGDVTVDQVATMFAQIDQAKKNALILELRALTERAKGQDELIAAILQGAKLALALAAVVA